MEFSVSINEKAVFVLLIVTAVVSVIGITMAAPPDPGHAWDEIECTGCVTESNLADGSVTNVKISAGLEWSKLADVPAGLADGDDVGLTSEADPTVPSWAKGGTCPCGTCWASGGITTPCANSYYRMCTPSGWVRTTTTYDTCSYR